MSFGKSNGKLPKSISSSSLQSTASSSSLSSVNTALIKKRINAVPFSKRIYDVKEEDLSEHIDFAYKNMAIYQYASLLDKEPKLKAKEQKLKESYERLSLLVDDNRKLEIQIEKKRDALNKLQLLKSAIKTGNEMKQFSESIEHLCRDNIPLSISNEEFSELKESIEAYNSKHSSSNENYEQIQKFFNEISLIELEEQFITKMCDKQMYEKIKTICKQCDESYRKMFDLKQTIEQNDELLKKLNCQN